MLRKKDPQLGAFPDHRALLATSHVCSARVLAMPSMMASIAKATVLTFLAVVDCRHPIAGLEEDAVDIFS